MSEISRREFLEGTGAGLAAAALPSLRARLPAPTPGEPAPAAAPRTVIRIVLNDVERHLEVENRWTLAELLRDHLGLSGTTA